MNCINHPETPAAAYCQNCGKPLCPECVHSVGNVVYCEPCLAARLGIPLAGQPLPDPALYDRHPNPTLAAILGLIPGVGAMYNGQFVKAMVHVLIFAALVSLASRSDFFGVFVAAWIFYQVFDAHQTAKARRDHLPLPDPFGFNDLGSRLGIPKGVATPPPAAPYTAPFWSGTASVPINPAPEAAVPYQPLQVDPAITGAKTNEIPGGAIALIAIGLLLLFQTLGILRGEWIDRGWPLLIVAAGVWLLYRRTRHLPRGGAQ